MSTPKRIGTFRDPTSRRGTAELVLEHIASVLSTISPRERGVIEARFGLRDGELRTSDEIGEVYGVTRERIRQIEQKVMDKLRHPSRSQSLRDLLGEDLPHLPQHVRDRALGHPAQAALPRADLLFCARHGWQQNDPRYRPPTCGGCPCPVRTLYSPYGGRPRRYCSPACRQGAYRQRRTRGRSSGAQ